MKYTEKSNDVAVVEQQTTPAFGKVEISPEVIQTIAGLSACQVEGVHSLGGVTGVSDLAPNNWFNRLGVVKNGVKVNLSDETTVIDIALVVNMGIHIPTVGSNVQKKVKEDLESMIGITVSSINIRIDSIKSP